MNGTPSWTVAGFAARTGVPSSTLRWWDDQGLLPADRLANGHRRCRPAHLPRLEMIRMCQALGATSEEIRLVLDSGDPGERSAYAARTLPVGRERLAALAAAERVLEHVAECSHPDVVSCGEYLRALLA